MQAFTIYLPKLACRVHEDEDLLQFEQRPSLSAPNPAEHTCIQSTVFKEMPILIAPMRAPEGGHLQRLETLCMNASR